MRKLLLGLFLSVGNSVLAEDVVLNMMEIQSISSKEDRNHGPAGELIQEAIKRAGYNLIIHDVPTQRALNIVPGEKNVLIAPIARLSEREAEFTWIAALVRVDRAFFSVGKSVDSFKKAKQTFNTVAVTKGTANVLILKEHGFEKKQIVEVNKGDSAPSMLLAGHVDAWFNNVAEVKLALKDFDGAQKIIQSGPMGGSINYLACSKICDATMVQKIRQSFKAMQADGTLKKIASRYSRKDGFEVIEQPLEDPKN